MSYSINANAAMVNDAEAQASYQPKNAALQAEFDRVYSVFVEELESQVKDTSVFLTYDDKQNLTRMFQLLLDLHDATNE